MIEKFMPLVETRAKSWAAGSRAARQHYDQLLSEGYLCLCELTEKLKEQENPEAYLISAMNWRFKRYLRYNADVFKIPKHADIDKHQSSTPAPLSEDILGEDAPGSQDELLEEILSHCRTDVERTVVALRADGYNDSDIAEMLRLPARSVCRARARVQRRYEDAAA